MHRRNAPTARPVFKGSCTVDESVGDAVFISGEEVDGVFPVRRAHCTSWSKMPAVGFIIAKPSDEVCYVQQAGQLPKGVLSGLTRGKTYKVGQNGALVQLAPAPGAGGYSVVQFMGLAMSVDEFHVAVDYQLKVNR